MSSHRPTPAVLLALLALLASPALPACKGDPDVPVEARPTVEVAQVQATSLADVIPISAVLEAQEWQALYFQQQGLVAKVNVSEGESVREGQLLASLDTALQQNQVAQAEQQLAGAELDLEQASHDHGQLQAMAAAEAASPEALRDGAMRVREAENRVEQARLQLESQQIKLRQMRLTAPFSGVLAEVNIRPGDRIVGEADDPDRSTGSRPPLVLIDPSSYELRASVPEGQSDGLEVGLGARVRGLDGSWEPLEGTVSWVAPSVDRDSRTVAFRIEVDLPEGGAPSWLRDGSTAVVELLAEQRPDAVVVPDRALVYHKGEAFVYVVERGVVERVAIEQGVVSEGRVEVRDGLEVGQQVAISNLHLLSDGLAVNPEEVSW